MKLAVICLAYLESLSGVEMLAQYFARVPADIYVHVDAKVSIEAYRALPELFPHVRILTERHPIWWGGFNTIAAIVAALRYIQGSNHYDRYMLITEDTAPLISPDNLNEYLRKDVEFIHSSPVTDDPSDDFRRRYSEWYFLDSLTTNPRRNTLPDWGLVDDEFMTKMLDMAELRKIGKKPLPCPHLRLGSTWWALSDEAVAQILWAHENWRWLRRSFEFSAIPEENYFHTILWKSGWKRKLHPFIHVDFSRGVGPFVYRSQSEVTALREGPYCMVRKVDIDALEIQNYMRSITFDLANAFVPSEGKAGAAGDVSVTMRSRIFWCSIMVHVAMKGDLPAEGEEWAGDRQYRFAVEGFLLTPPREVGADGLTYRALYRDSIASSLRTSGAFCGSRGAARPLIGYVVELPERLSASWRCECWARFTDGSQMGPVPAGQACSSSTGASLVAMRVALVRSGE